MAMVDTSSNLSCSGAWHLVENEVSGPPPPKPDTKCDTTKTPKKKFSHSHKCANPLCDTLMNPFAGLDLGPLPGQDTFGPAKSSQASKARLGEPMQHPADMLPSTSDDTLRADGIRRFAQWDRTAYITHDDASPEDFHRFLWLLRFGQPDTWYLQPSEALKTSLTGYGVDAPASLLVRFAEAMPARLESPRICMGQAMTSDLQIFDGDTSVPRSHPQSRKSLIGRLRYLSVVQAPHMHGEFSVPEKRDPYGPFQSDYPMADAKHQPRSPLYKLVSSGSHQAAAAQAFYDAGANGWSTLFTCVVLRRDATRLGCPELDANAERMDSLEALLRAAEAGITRAKVFY